MKVEGGKNKFNELVLLSDSFLLALDDLFVDGNLQCQSLLDLHKFLILRPQPLNLPVEEANLGVFRLDLSKTRKVRVETILVERQHSPGTGRWLPAPPACQSDQPPSKW